MPLSNINYAAGQDSMQDVFDKTNLGIDTINVQAGGVADQMLTKDSATDFDYTWKNISSVLAAYYSAGTWTDFTLSSGYTSAAESGSNAKAQYRKDTFGNIEIKGHITVGVIATNTFATLPVAHRPASPRIYMAGSYGGTTFGDFVLVVNSNGDIQVVNQDGTNLAAAKQFYIDVIKFNINS